MQSGEIELGKLPSTYFPPSGGKYAGNIIITNYRLIFVRSNSINDSICLDLFRSDISSVMVKTKIIKTSILISSMGKIHSFTRFFYKPDDFINLLKI